MNQQTQQMITAFIRSAIADPIQRESALKVISNTPAKRDTMLKTREAARFAGVCVQTLRLWEIKGFLHPKHITPRRVRWSKTELENFLCEKTEA